MTNTLKKYFEFFSNKDLNNLKKLFSEDVTLIDWNLSAFGVEEVMSANKSIFDSVDTIKVFVESIYENPKDKSYLCLIDIVINNTELIKVSDIIVNSIRFDGRENVEVGRRLLTL